MAATLIPRPSVRPISLLALYRRITKDTKAPRELVHATMQTDSFQRVLVVSLKMKGYTDRQIAGALGVRPESVRDRIEGAMVRVWKVVNNAPRYYRKGHKGNISTLKQYQEKEAA